MTAATANTDNDAMTTQPGERYVQLDSGGPAFPALVEAASWNGWLRPRFRPAAAHVLIRWLNEQADTDAHGELRGRFDGDTLITDEGEHSDTHPPGQDGRYPIGAGGWCWTYPDHLHPGETKESAT